MCARGGAGHEWAVRVGYEQCPRIQRYDGRGTYKSIPVAVVAELPLSGIGAVTMMINVADSQGTGRLFAPPSADESST